MLWLKFTFLCLLMSMIEDFGIWPKYERGYICFWCTKTLEKTPKLIFLSPYLIYHFLLNTDKFMAMGNLPLHWIYQFKYSFLALLYSYSKFNIKFIILILFSLSNFFIFYHQNEEFSLSISYILDHFFFLLFLYFFPFFYFFSSAIHFWTPLASNIDVLLGKSKKI